MHILSVVSAILERWGVWGIFFSMFIENIAIPLPIEIGYVTAIMLMDTGAYPYWFMLLIVTLGHVAGASCAYGIGYFGSGWIERHIARHSEFHEVREKVIRWYERYGDITAFAVRFNGYVRLFSSYVGGLAEYPFGRFIVYTALGSVVFNIGALAVSRIIMQIWRSYVSLHIVIGSALAISFFGGIVFVALQKHVRKRKTALHALRGGGKE